MSGFDWRTPIGQMIADRSGLSYKPMENPAQEYNHLLTMRNSEPAGSRLYSVWNDAAVKLNQYMHQHEGSNWQAHHPF